MACRMELLLNYLSDRKVCSFASLSETHCSPQVATNPTFHYPLPWIFFYSVYGKWDSGKAVLTGIYGVQ